MFKPTTMQRVQQAMSIAGQAVQIRAAKEEMRFDVVLAEIELARLLLEEDDRQQNKLVVVPGRA